MNCWIQLRRNCSVDITLSYYKMHLYSVWIDGTSCNEALHHIGGKKIDCSSMVVFLNIVLLKYYHAHNIHHCPFYPISNIGLVFAIQYWKVSFCLFLTFLGRKLEERYQFGYTQLCFIKHLSTVWFLLRLY